jgi:hypothetical protein
VSIALGPALLQLLPFAASIAAAIILVILLVRRRG